MITTVIKKTKKDIHHGHLILVNRDHPLHQHSIQRTPLSPLSSADFCLYEGQEILLEQNCCRQLTSLVHTIGATQRLIAVSGYRDVAEQRQIYSTSLQENGADFTAKYVARPMESEHQTGLAIDLSEQTESVDFIRPSFPNQGICHTFKQLASSFGFIERYRHNKQYLTGISAEPWHFRYVGIPHAQIIEENNLCLEEYMEFLRSYTYEQKHLWHYCRQGLAEIYYIESSADVTEIPLPQGTNYQISGNNCDGFIVTVFHSN